MTITTPRPQTPHPGSARSDVSESDTGESDVVLLGGWTEIEPGSPVHVPQDGELESSNAYRDPRKWYESVGRVLRSWRPSAVLALLVVTAALLMLLDLRDGPTQVLRSWGQSAGGTAQEWADLAIGPVRDTPLRRADEPTLQSHIADLERRNEVLKQKNVALDTRLREVAEAGKVTTWAQAAGIEIIPARVVAVESGRLPNRSVTIDVGSRDGLERNLAVVGQGALVGRLVDVGPSTSTVQLISDHGSRIWSRIAESREAVVAAGSGVGIELEFVDRLARVEQGQKLVTMGSPESRPYPPGIPLARVVSVSRIPGDVGLRVMAEPIADLGSLEVVGVVPPRSEGDNR